MVGTCGRSAVKCTLISSFIEGIHWHRDIPAMTWFLWYRTTVGPVVDTSWLEKARFRASQLVMNGKQLTTCASVGLFAPLYIMFWSWNMDWFLFSAVDIGCYICRTKLRTTYACCDVEHLPGSLQVIGWRELFMAIRVYRSIHRNHKSPRHIYRWWYL